MDLREDSCAISRTILALMLVTVVVEDCDLLATFRDAS